MTGKPRGPRRTLKFIDHYPSNEELYKNIVNGPGWPYKKDMEYYLKRDRALASLQFLLGCRISELLRLTRNQIDWPKHKGRYIKVNSILLSKAIRKDRPRKHVYRAVALLDTQGSRAPLTELVTDYLDLLGPKQKLFLIKRRRAHQIIVALLGIPDHWLRAYCENDLYDIWEHDLLAVADYLKVDSQTLAQYIRGSWQKYVKDKLGDKERARKE